MFTNLINDIQSRISLSPGEISLLPSWWKVASLSKNEYLVRNGDICRHDSFVVQGSLKAFYINAKTGKEEILFLAIENWWATDLDSFRNKTPSIYNIQALEDSVLLQIDQPSFEAMLAAIPALHQYFLLILERYVAVLHKRIIMQNSHTAEERYRYFVERYPALFNRVPQYLIASYLGMSAEFLSRIRAKKQ